MFQFSIKQKTQKRNDEKKENIEKEKEKIDHSYDL